MLENLRLSFLIVFPFLAYMTIGFLLRKFRVVEDEFTARLNRFLAGVLLPVNIFNSLYDKDLSSAFKNPTALYCGAGVLLLTLVLIWLVPKWEKDPAKQGAMIHCGFRGNCMLYALPIAQGIFGRDVPEVVIVLAVVVLINNFEAVPILEHYRNKTPKYAASETSSRLSFKEMVLGWLKTPLLIGVLLGTLWALLRIPMPVFCGNVISGMAGTVIPLAFMTLGARLNFGHLKANKKNVIRMSLIKLVAAPAVMLLLPLLAHWPEESVVAVMVGLGAPSAVICYAMTELYECDADTAGEIVSLSSALSMITIFLWIFGLKQMGFIH